MSKIIERTQDEMMEFPMNLRSTSKDSEFEEMLNYLYSQYDYQDELKFYNEMFFSDIVDAYKLFLLGRFYVFDYRYENLSTRETKYLDTRPIVFVLDNQFSDNTRKIKGINFNYLDELSRINFLQIYFNIYRQILDSDLWYTLRGDYNIYKLNPKELEVFHTAINKEFLYISNATRYWDYNNIVESTVSFVRFDDYNILFKYSGFEDSIKGRYWESVQQEIMKKPKYR